MPKSFASADPSLERYIPIARLISGDPSGPIWLAEQLRAWSPTLTIARGMDHQMPTRLQLVKLTTQAVAACDFLAGFLRSPVLLDFISLGVSTGIDIAGTQQALFDMRSRAKTVLNDPEYVGPNGQAKPGRNKAFPAGAQSAKVDCAAIVAEAWLLCRGKQVAPRNEQACRAAQALWEASGGDSKGWGASPLQGWRPYFKRAEDRGVATHRQEIRRHLQEARWAALSPSVE